MSCVTGPGAGGAEHRLRAAVFGLAVCAGALSALAVASVCWGAPKTLYVDQDGKGARGVPGSVACDNTRSRAQVDIDHPWCDPGTAGLKASEPGDVVLIRSSARPYWRYGGGSPSSVPWCAECSADWGTPALPLGGINTVAMWEPRHKGVSTPGSDPPDCARPITFKNHPGESPVIAPRPEDHDTRCFGGFSGEVDGVVYGLYFGTNPGRCVGGADAGQTCTSDAACASNVCAMHQCYNAVNAGTPCRGKDDITTCAGPNAICDNTPWCVVIEGITFRDFDYRDEDVPPKPRKCHAGPDKGKPCRDGRCADGAWCGPGNCSQQWAVNAPESAPPQTGVTIRNCRFEDNEGAGTLIVTQGVGWTIEGNVFSNNHLHGYTSAHSFWKGRGKRHNWRTVFRRNEIYRTDDTNVPWCTRHVCSDGTPLDDADRDRCWDTVRGRGERCPCLFDSDCLSGDCVDLGPRVGGCGQEGECWDVPQWIACSDASECPTRGPKACKQFDDGYTEGNALIVDRGSGVCATNPKVGCSWLDAPECHNAFCTGAGTCEIAGAPASCPQCTGAHRGNYGATGNAVCFGPGNPYPCCDGAGTGTCAGPDWPTFCAGEGSPWIACTAKGAAGNPCLMGMDAWMLIENNIAWDNAGAGFNSFVSSHVTMRNNVSANNNQKHSWDFGEVLAFGDSQVVANNVVVPRPVGVCTCRPGPDAFGDDADCTPPGQPVRVGSCWLWGSWGHRCRNGSRSVCTSDGQCAAGQRCDFLKAYRMTFQGEAYSPATMCPIARPSTLRFSGNHSTLLGGLPKQRLVTLMEWATGSDWTTDGKAGDSLFHSPYAAKYGWAGQGDSVLNLYADPRFAGPTTGAPPARASFRPLAGSPVLNVGDWPLRAPTDILGVVRTDPPSLGAYEDGLPPPPPPAAPAAP